MNPFIIVAVIASVVAIILLVLLATHKRKMAEVEKARHNYESIIDQANDAMLVIDIVDGRIHQSNPSAASMLGYSQQQLEEKSLFDLHPREFLNESSSIVADVWEKGGLIYKHIPFVSASGELLPVECSAKVAPFAGRPAIVIYARDIRERLRLEKEVNQQKEIIEQKNKDITDSIEYAKKIQEAILPAPAELAPLFSDAFVLFLPKDIVSGDFYWFTRKGEKVIVAVADCTGHGVPGAFMSMVGNSILHEVIIEQNITSPGAILDALKVSILKVFKKREDGGQRRDGMDIALISYVPGSGKVEFAGAFNSLILASENGFSEYKGDKFPVGYYEGVEDKNFKTHHIDVKSGDCLYLLSDGFVDQFGGPAGKKFKSKKFMEVLQQTWTKPLNEQQKILLQEHKEWKGDHEQVDDICVIGVRI